MAERNVSVTIKIEEEEKMLLDKLIKARNEKVKGTTSQGVIVGMLLRKEAKRQKISLSK